MTAAPIFIVGSYRSGTSILTWCLGQHSNIWLLPETYWISQFARSIPELYNLGTAQDAAHFKRCGVSEDILVEEAGRFVDRVVQRGQQQRLRKQIHQWQNGAEAQKVMRLQRNFTDPKQRWVDGTPENSHSIEALHKLFPEGRFIHLVRSPHEVVRSLASFDKAGGDPQETQTAYATWRGLTEAVWNAEQVLGSHVVRRFKFSDLADYPEALMTSICEFIDEDFESAMLQPLQNKINSSKVDDQTIPSLETLPEDMHDTYQDNQTFFEALIA